jgi:hypothetical protein
MEAVEVLARFDAHGKAFPVQFTWQERVYQVTSTGRRWQDQTGYHLLVMTLDVKTYELVFNPSDLCWYLKTLDLRSKKALST